MQILLSPGVNVGVGVKVGVNVNVKVEVGVFVGTCPNAGSAIVKKNKKIKL